MNETTLEDRIACRREANAARAELREECADVHAARNDVCDLIGEGIYDPDFTPENFIHPDDVTMQNPYWPMGAGHTDVVTAGGEEIEELIVIHVTDRIRYVDGVPCRIVVDAAFEIETGDDEGDDEKRAGGVTDVEYVIGEITDDWYAHHNNGDIWYCGERVLNFEDGILVNQDGSFEAGKEGAKAGILIPFAPEVGQAYRQEFALDEAEDLAVVMSLASSPPDKGDTGFACDGECLQTYEFTPLEPSQAEYKYYLHGIGFVKALSLEDGELDGESENLMCSGDSLDVLSDPSCGIANVEQLRDALCEVAPETFCDGD